MTSRSVTLQWSPPSNTGGVELTGYIVEKQRSSARGPWERAATLDSTVTLFVVENLKERSEYKFRVSAENEVGSGEPAETPRVGLRTHARRLTSARDTFACMDV